ncbi:hypothetical protein GQ53DRAFT_319889 [Thozetella sp. PMI_491]|nr:hypothetical protein GQ53DRAFT_319889 [Thozetella sp. PMI_491]
MSDKYFGMRPAQFDKSLSHWDRLGNENQLLDAVMTLFFCSLVCSFLPVKPVFALSQTQNFVRPLPRKGKENIVSHPKSGVCQSRPVKGGGRGPGGTGEHRRGTGHKPGVKQEDTEAMK